MHTTIGGAHRAIHWIKSHILVSSERDHNCNKRLCIWLKTPLQERVNNVAIEKYVARAACEQNPFNFARRFIDLHREYPRTLRMLFAGHCIFCGSRSK